MAPGWTRRRQILIAVESCVRADLEGIGDRIVEAGLDAMARDGRDLIARQDLNIAVFVGERAVGADLQRVEKTRVDEGIAGVELQRA